MIRHTNSLIISLLIHVLFFSVLIFTFEQLFVSTPKREESRVCVNLHTCIETKEAPPIIKNKPILKPVKKEPKEKKKRVKVKKEVVVKKVLTKKPKLQKQVQIEKKEPTQVISEVSFEKSQVIKRVEDESKLIVTPTKSELHIQKNTKLTPQKEYVDRHLAEIFILLQENLYYPRRARKRGLEGEVVVKFNLSKNAEVSSIEVLSSSSEVLSRGAIKTIEELSLKFPKPTTNLTLSVPISYKLN